MTFVAKVWVSKEIRFGLKWVSLKLQTNWEGPYTVKKRINDDVYWIQQEGQQKFTVFHVHHLAKYYCRDSLLFQDKQV